MAALPNGDGLDPALAAEAPSALMAAPLIVTGRVAGVVEVGTRAARRFDAGEESLLMLMADRAGLAVEHARAYERELSNVEMLQRSLLPERLPYVEGIQIAARYMPGGADVGGDWYDAIPLEDGRLGVAMGDVVGHGIGAASLMGQLRHATRAYALEGHSPEWCSTASTGSCAASRAARWPRCSTWWWSPAWSRYGWRAPVTCRRSSSGQMAWRGTSTARRTRHSACSPPRRTWR